MKKLFMITALAIMLVAPVWASAPVVAASPPVTCTSESSTKASKIWRADDELNGLKFYSTIHYRHCTSIVNRYDVFQSLTLKWTGVLKGDKTWSCGQRAGNIHSVVMNPDSLAGHDYGNVTWKCTSAGGGTKTFNFADKRYNAGQGGAQRCTKVTVTIDRAGFNGHATVPNNCVR